MNTSLHFTNHKVVNMIVTFTKDKETKNKVRYSVLPQNTTEGIMGTIYVDKDTEFAKETEIKVEILEEIYQDVV